MNQITDLLIIRRIRKNNSYSLLYLLQILSDTSKEFFHPHPFNKKTIEKICSSENDYYFVMLLNETMIGYSFLRFFSHKTPSYRCCIDGLFENKGYGAFLTEWTLKTAKKLGYPKIILRVYINNKRALNMYNKIGFVPIKLNSEEKEIIMEYNLI